MIIYFSGRAAGLVDKEPKKSDFRGGEGAEGRTFQRTKRRVFQRSNSNVHFNTSKHRSVARCINRGGTIWNGVRVYEWRWFESIFAKCLACRDITGLKRKGERYYHSKRFLPTLFKPEKLFHVDFSQLFTHGMGKTPPLPVQVKWEEQ